MAKQGAEPGSLDFTPGLFPVSPYRVLSTIPFRVFLPYVTPPSPSQPLQSPIPTFLPQIRKARCPPQAHCGRYPSTCFPPTLPPTQFLLLSAQSRVTGPRPLCALQNCTPPSLARTPARHQSPPAREAPPLAVPPLPLATALTPRPLSPVKPLSVEDLCFGLAALPCGGALAHGARDRGRLPVTDPRHLPLPPPLPTPAVAAAATAAGPARPP